MGITLGHFTAEPDARGQPARSRSCGSQGATRASSRAEPYLTVSSPSCRRPRGPGPCRGTRTCPGFSLAVNVDTPPLPTTSPSWITCPPSPSARCCAAPRTRWASRTRPSPAGAFALVEAKASAPVGSAAISSMPPFAAIGLLDTLAPGLGQRAGVLAGLAGHRGHVGGHVAGVLALDEVGRHDAAAPHVGDLASAPRPRRSPRRARRRARARRPRPGRAPRRRRCRRARARGSAGTSRRTGPCR